MEDGTGRGQKSRKQEDNVVLLSSSCHVSHTQGFSPGKEGIFANFLEK